MWTVFTARGQEITQVGDVETDSFPQVRFRINVYNPEWKSPEDFQVLENNRPRPFRLEKLKTEPHDTTKAVLILFEDMLKYHGHQRRDFKEILRQSLPRIIHKGDAYNIAFFDRNRDGTTPLRFALSEYTDHSAELLNALEAYNPPPDRFNQQPSSDLYNAIYDGITDLTKRFPGRNKILVVLSGGKNLELSNYNSLSDLIAYAKKNKIPVYSLQYMVYEHENIDALARDTYGKFFHIQGTYPLQGDHSVSTAADSLTAFMNRAVERMQGKNYAIAYTSAFERDGKLHNVAVKTDNYTKEITFRAPECDWKCYMDKHPRKVLAALAGIVILLAGLLFMWARHKKRRRQKELRLQQVLASQEQELDSQRQIAMSIEQKAEEAERKAQLLEEQLRKEQQLLKQLDEQRRLQEIIQEMKGGKGFARLRVVRGQGYTDYEINKPRFSVGKKAGNDLVLDDKTVSGHHFVIHYENHGYRIEDLNSTNGTYVNGQRIRKAPLKHNDIIQAGNTKLIFIQ